METKQMYIDGHWVNAKSNHTRDIINPFNRQVIATVAEGGHEDAKAAIHAAKKSFDHRTWRDVPANERGRIVTKIAQLIELNKEKLAKTETLNSGKTMIESREDMDMIADVFRYYGGLADKYGGEMIDSPIPDSKSEVVYEPAGVCGMITPWNYPLLQASWKIAPALAAGCSLIIKPSEITPLTTINVIELIEEAGVPAGVANLVLGPGQGLGSELSENHDVDLISFTGGIETGKQIMQVASDNVKKVALELGGKNPNIVFGDSPFETAVDQALNAVYFHAGQVCSAGARLLVEDTIHDEFVEALKERAKHIKLGDGMKEDTQSGPLISEEHRNKVEHYVEIAQNEGATLVLGGKRPDDAHLQEGYFYLPTIFTDCDSDMRIVQEETFGPILTVERFKSTEEAIQKANDTIYGLAGAVWSDDIEKAEYVAAKLRMGTVWINDFHPYFAQAPWGGYKQSGIGRELGKEGFGEYLEVKHIYRNTNPLPIHWF